MLFSIEYRAADLYAKKEVWSYLLQTGPLKEGSNLCGSAGKNKINKILNGFRPDQIKSTAIERGGK